MPSSSYVKATIIPQLEQLCKPSQDTHYLCSGILSLLCNPSELHNLNGTTLLSRCMLALRHFTDDSDPQSNKLFSYEYGFLCFRVIVLLMHVGTLVHANTFDKFMMQTNNLCGPHEISATLSEVVLERLGESWNPARPRDWLMDTPMPQGGERTLLGAVGGFTSDDARYLLKILWHDRKGFTEICTQTSTPGWLLPLMLIEEHMLWEERYKSNNINGEDWYYLLALCLRYSLVASERESRFLEMICAKALVYSDHLDRESDPELEVPYDTTNLVDARDTRVMLQAYITRMTISTQAPFPRLITSQFGAGFLQQEEILDIPDLMPSLIKVSCSRVWAEIDASSGSPEPASENPALIKSAAHAFDLISRVYPNYIGAPVEIISTLDKALVEIDFINLFGKMAFLPLVIGSSISKPENPGNPKELDDTDDLGAHPRQVTDHWDDLTHTTLSIGTSYGMVDRPANVNKPLDRYYPDWLKTWRCYDAHFPQHNTQSELLRNHTDLGYMSLYGFGSSLGFWDRKERTEIECAYPRCPAAAFESDPQFFCERCLAAPYCSHLCQARHWASTTREPHRDLCPGKCKSATQKTD